MPISSAVPFGVPITARVFVLAVTPAVTRSLVTHSLDALPIDESWPTAKVARVE